MKPLSNLIGEVGAGVVQAAVGGASSYAPLNIVLNDKGQAARGPFIPPAMRMRFGRHQLSCLVCAEFPLLRVTRAVGSFLIILKTDPIPIPTPYSLV